MLKPLVIYLYSVKLFKILVDIIKTIPENTITTRFKQHSYEHQFHQPNICILMDY